MVQLLSDAPSPRLCIVEKVSPDQEYGYNLHAERGRGQFVGMVDKGSPADLGGLRTGDRIFAVNGRSIVGESHKKVVERIKENPVRCEMLVISEEGAQWYQENGIEINMSLPNIERVSRSGVIKANGSPPPAAGWYAPSSKATDPVFVAPPPPPPAPSNEEPLIMNKPRARLCKLEKTSASQEFGFNLHAEKGRGHFIGTVDQGGIGDRAGLRMGQRIVGVNGVLVYPNTPHKEVVAQIKRSPLRTTLLVASEEVDRWYKEHGAEFSFDYIEEDSLTVHQQLSPHSAEQTTITTTATANTTNTANAEHIEVEEVHENATQHRSSMDETKPTMDKSALSHVATDEESVTVLQKPETGTELELLTRAKELEQKAIEIVRPPSSTSSTHSSHESAVDVQQSHYGPTYQSNNHKDTTAISSINNESNLNGYQASNNSASTRPDKFDIYHLSAQEARERIRQNKKNIHRGFDMSLEEKYRLVSNM